MRFGTGLPDFLGAKYQNEKKDTKLPRTMPNAHKKYQLLPLQDPPKFTQFWIFGLKTNHLVTLVRKEPEKSDVFSRQKNLF
jgi:hypothetical protein